MHVRITPALLPCQEAAAAAQSVGGGQSFLGWFSQVETIPAGQRDEVAEHLLRDVFANPLQVRGTCWT